MFRRCCFFFFKQKTAYEMRISDWSSDVCSSDLQELAICGIVFEPERVEPRRRAGAQHVIASADRADEQLAAAVLVEEDDARIELARLREQEIERHGLSRTRRADDRDIAAITLVKVEDIRPCRGRLAQGERNAPMIALALVKFEIIPHRQPLEIAFRNANTARTSVE